ncbi:hypothetical protein Pmar_PMAR017593, partial [Perkinsus marinus ATCC 50983]
VFDRSFFPPQSAWRGSLRLGRIAGCSFRSGRTTGHVSDADGHPGKRNLRRCETRQ